MTEGRHTLRIDFTADFICPFCYLGRRRLQIAMRLAREEGLPVTFDLRYHPYDIAKGLSREGRDKRAWYLEKNGGDVAQNERMIEAMKAMGTEVGIAFDYDGTVANTADAHRVIMRVQSGRLGDVEALVDSLCRQYFEERRHPSAPETLLRACEEAGVEDLAAVERFLGTDELAEEVADAIVEANMDGLQGVPSMVFEGRRRDFTLTGAKAPLEYYNTMRQVLKELV